jgi:hypothetical protein
MPLGMRHCQWGVFKSLAYWGFTLGFPFYYGADGRGILAPAIWIAFIAGSNVATGWRHEDWEVVKFFAVGLMFAAIAVFPAFYLGRWLLA